MTRQREESFAVKVTLISLGLTASQANVYLTLAKLGSSTAKSIALSSKIARQEVYRVLEKLYDMSLIEKIVSTPTKYTSVPIEDGLAILLQHKQNEGIELERKTLDLINYYRNNSINTMLREEEDGHIVLVPKKEAFIRRALRGNYKERMDIITTDRRIMQGRLNAEEAFKKALKKGIRVRIIKNEASLGKRDEKWIEALKTNPLFQVRYLPKMPPTPVAIIDNEITIVTSATLDWYKATTLFSNNARIVALIKDYFELLWNTAKSTPSQV